MNPPTCGSLGGGGGNGGCAGRKWGDIGGGGKSLFMSTFACPPNYLENDI